MSHNCIANHKESRNCVNNKAAHCDTDPTAECDGNRECYVWPRKSRKSGDVLQKGAKKRDVEKDYLCMTLDDHNMMGDSDTITWNGQERSLTAKGKQGRRNQPQDVVEGLCAIVCMDKFGFPLMRGVKSGQSHQEIHEHIDDMCDNCR